MRKIIIITGVGKGFGKALMKYFVNDYHVIGITRSNHDIAALERELFFANGNFDLIAADITTYELLEEKLSCCIANKSESIYALINNAGVRCRKSFLSLSIADIKSVVEVNLFSAVFLSKLLIPYFVDNGGGRIINISSILSTNALPDLSAYALSKAALDGFTRSIAVEFAQQGITCNSILPGFCKTSYFSKFQENHELYNMTVCRVPSKHWGSDTELIGVCELLLGTGGDYINGTSIPVDGGWTAC